MPHALIADWLKVGESVEVATWNLGHWCGEENQNIDREDLCLLTLVRFF
jgi:hypothetical protein